MSDAPHHHHQRRHLGRARIADGVVSALFMLLGFWVSYVSITRLQAFQQGQVGPGVLPFMIGVTLVLTSASIMFSLRRGAAIDGDAEMPTPREAGRAVSLLVLMVAAVLLIPIVGTIVSLGVFMFAELFVLERRGWRISVATALIVPALLYLFFEALLGVPLPTGALDLL